MIPDHGLEPIDALATNLRLDTNPNPAGPAPASARLSPQGRDEASDGRRIGPDGDAEDQAGWEDDFDRGVRDDANRGERWRGP